VKEVIDTLSGIRGFEWVGRVQERKREERVGFAYRGCYFSKIFCNSAKYHVKSQIEI